MMAVTEICVTPTDLAAFLEGSLTGEERDRMVRHLNHCPDCFERYIEAARLLDAIEEEEALALSASDVNVMEQNLLHEYQQHVWGKWRPSAGANLEAKLPSRNPRRFTDGEEVLQSQHSLQMTPDEFAESAEKRRRVQGLLLEALATLSPEDRLIAKMRAQFSVSEIAQALNLEQKPLYRRLEKIFKSLRSTLERSGVSAEDIADIHLEHESDKSGK